MTYRTAHERAAETRAIMEVLTVNDTWIEYWGVEGEDRQHDTHTHTHTLTHTHTHTPGAVETHTHTHTHTHTEQWRHTHTHTHTCSSGDTHTHTHLEQWRHTHTHTWSSGDTHTHTHTHSLSAIVVEGPAGPVISSALFHWSRSTSDNGRAMKSKCSPPPLAPVSLPLQHRERQTDPQQSRVTRQQPQHTRAPVTTSPHLYLLICISTRRATTHPRSSHNITASLPAHLHQHQNRKQTQRLTRNALWWVHLMSRITTRTACSVYFYFISYTFYHDLFL